MKSLLLAVVIFSVCFRAHAQGIGLKHLVSGQLELRVDFAQKGAHLQPIYRPGSPVGEQVGLIVKGMPQDFKLVREQLAGQKVDLASYPRVQQSPCRCDNPYVVAGPVAPLSVVAPVELNYLGDFRGVPLTKITLREVALKNDELMLLESATYTLARLDGERATIFESSDLILPASLLIVTPERFVAEVELLAKIERNHGIQVVVKTLEELGANFWDLKRSLKSLYTELSFGHVLFIGDEDIFPTDLVQTSTDFQTPSDMQYFLMGPASDRLPDVSGARLAVSEAREIELYRHKLETYYAQAASKRAIMVASNEGSAPSDVEYVRQMAAPLSARFGLAVSEVLQADQSTSAEYLLQELEKGNAWLNYIGHGSGYSWPSVYGAEFELTHVRALSSHNRPFVLIDVACQNGRFKNDERLGMEFIFHHDQSEAAGAVAYYGGSVDISWHPPAVMAVAINEDVARSPSSTLGEHLLRGQFKLIERFDDLEAALENLVWYHLQGVPTLRPKL